MSNTTNTTIEISEHNRARVGRFQSRYSEGRTLRQGVKDHVFLRSIHAVSEDGHSLRHVCYVECPANENWVTHNETRILPVMRLLEAGRKAMIAEQLSRA